MVQGDVAANNINICLLVICPKSKQMCIYMFLHENSGVFRSLNDMSILIIEWYGSQFNQNVRSDMMCYFTVSCYICLFVFVRAHVLSSLILRALTSITRVKF